MDLFCYASKLHKDVSRFKGFVLVVPNEKRCIRICDQMYGVSKSEGRAPSSFRIIAVY